MRSSRIVSTRPWRLGIHPPTRTTSLVSIRFLSSSQIPPRRNSSAAPSSPAAAPNPQPEPSSPAPIANSERVPRSNATAEQNGGVTDVLRAALKEKGEAFVGARFEALAVRQLSTTGRAATLGAALEEMRALGMKPTPSFYGTALAVLAVHPDYLLRATLLDAMRKDWIEKTPDHRVHTALGLMRDGQYEMAFDELEDMVAESVPVPPWVYDIFVFAFGRLGFLDEAMLALERRQQQHTQTQSTTKKTTPNPPADLLYFMLDTCSASYHHKGTKHFWRVASAEGAGVVPSDGTLVNILNTAARYADPSLALEALSATTARGVQLSFQHFEPVIDAYARSGDLPGAFRFLCVMDAAGVRPGRDATRSIAAALRTRPRAVPGCVDTLRTLAETYTVPIAALNVLVEALCHAGDTPAAEALFAEIPTLTPDPPTLTTFLPFLVSPDPPQAICALAIRSFPAMTLTALEFASLAAHTVPYSLDAALAYLRRIDAVYRPGRRPDGWVAHADAVRRVAVGLLEAQDPRMWEFLAEVGRRNPALAAEIRELGRKAEMEAASAAE